MKTLPATTTSSSATATSRNGDDRAIDCLYAGLDLGTSATCLVTSARGDNAQPHRELLPTVVGYAGDGILDGILPGNARMLFGHDALKHRMHLRLVRPLEGGQVADLEATRHFLRFLRARLGAGPETEVRAVIGVPAREDAAAREKLRSAVAGLFHKVLFVPEPFLGALGLRDESRLGDESYADPVRNSLFVDIGAGSTDACLVQGYFPLAEDQLSTGFGGDAVDVMIHQAIQQTYPDSQVSLATIRELKERHSFVMNADIRVQAEIGVAGKSRRIDLTEALSAGCEALLRTTFDLVKALVARADPDTVPELMQNIVLTGGGSLVQGLGVALQTLLVEDGYESPRVTIVGPDFKELVARGALKAARSAKDRQWQTLLR